MGLRLGLGLVLVLVLGSGARVRVRARIRVRGWGDSQQRAGVGPYEHFVRCKVPFLLYKELQSEA